MKTKLLKKVRQRYTIERYTHIDKRSQLYESLLGEVEMPTEEEPLYIIMDTNDSFVPIIGVYRTKEAAIRRLTSHIVRKYRYKFPKNKNISKKVWWN